MEDLDQPPPNNGSLGPHESAPKPAHDWFSCFTQSNRVSNTQIQIMEYVTTVETWPSAL